MEYVKKMYRKLRLWKWFRFYNFAKDEGYCSHSLRLFKLSVWAMYSDNRLMWFRLFGIGLHVKDVTLHGLTFSQRNGKKNSLQIGKWNISFLPYHKL